MNTLSKALRSTEVYEGCETSSEYSICSRSSSEPFMSPSSDARELYEGLRTPDWLEQTDSEVVGGEEWRVSPSLNEIKGIFKGGSKPFVPRASQKVELKEDQKVVLKEDQKVVLKEDQKVVLKEDQKVVQKVDQKVVLKVDLHDDKDKWKAMKAVASFSGIDSIAVEMKNRILTVIGDVDPVMVVSKLRKNWYTAILYVGPAKEHKK